MSDIDTAMPSSPTDSQLLTSQAIAQWAGNEVWATMAGVSNGATISNVSGDEYKGMGVLMPAFDDDCLAFWQVKLPDTVTGTVTITVYYWTHTDVNFTYAGLWSIDVWKAGETKSSNNILNDSGVHDLACTDAFDIETHQLYSGTTPVGGDLVHLTFQSDASNSYWVLIAGIKVEWSGA